MQNWQRHSRSAALTLPMNSFVVALSVSFAQKNVALTEFIHETASGVSQDLQVDCSAAVCVCFSVFAYEAR